MRSVIIIIFCFLSISIFAQENISVSILTIDNVNGDEVNANVAAFILPQNLAVNIKEEDGYKVITVKRGVKVKVVVSKDGFYTEEQVIDTQTLSTDAEVVEIRMSARPFAVLVLNAVFPPNKSIADTQVSIKFNGKEVANGIVSTKNKEFKTTVYEPGSYDIVASAPEMESMRDKFEVEVSPQAKVYIKDLVFGEVATEIQLEFFTKDNSPINGNFNLKSADGKKNIDGDIKNGKGNVKLDDSQYYELTTLVAGFINTSEKIRKDKKNYKIELKKPTNVLISALVQTIPKEAEVNIIDSKGKESKLFTSKDGAITFIPETVGIHKIVFTKEGYKKSETRFDISDLGGQTLNVKVELEPIEEGYQIFVFDEITKKPVPEALIKVFSENGDEIVKGKANGSNRDVELDKNKKYFFEVNADNYYDFTKNLSTEKIVNAYIKPKNKGIFKFVIRDEQTNVLINNPVFLLTDSENKPVEINKENEAILFFSKPYKLKAGANGFTTKEITINENAKKEIELKLSPLNEDQYVIQALDSLSREIIKADFILSIRGKPTEINDATRLFTKTATFDINNPVELQVESKGYLAKKKNIKSEDIENKTITVLMSRNFYPVKFVFDDNVSIEQVQQAFFQLKTNKGEKVAYQFNRNIKGFTANLDPKDSFNLSVESFGFEPFVDSFDIRKVAPKSNNFTSEKGLEYKISLIALTSVTMEIPKTDTVEEEPEVVTPEIKKEVVALEELPTDPSQLNSIFANPILGKKYRLAEVHFEQSEAVFLDGYEKQLDQLGSLMAKYPNNNIELIGYTDNVGNYKSNQVLSKLRAKVISNYLFNKFGIPNSRFILNGFGSLQPIANNDSEENKALNRRVEIAVIPQNTTN